MSLITDPCGVLSNATTVNIYTCARNADKENDLYRLAEDYCA